MNVQEQFDKADPFTRDYITCALWCGIEENYSLMPSDLAPPTYARMALDCAAFLSAMQDTITAADETGECKRGPNCDTAEGRAGHDFWLTRNGHGAGFWDGDWPEPIATALDQAAKRAGSFDLYIGDDGLIYGM